MDVCCKGWVEGEESGGGQKEAWGFISNDALCKFSLSSVILSLLLFILSFYFTFIFPFSLSSSSCFFFLSFPLKCPLPPTPLAHGKAKNVFYIILNHEAVWNELLGSNEPLL